MKKGSIVDIIGAVTLVFFFAISAILGWVILDEFGSSTAVTASGLNTTYIDQAKDATEVWDWGILFILFGSMLFALITAYMVDTHPALFIFGIIVFMIALVITMIVSNAFYAFYNTTELASGAAAFPNLINVMDHLVEIMIVYGFIMLIVVYGKLRYNFGGGI